MDYLAGNVQLVIAIFESKSFHYKRLLLEEPYLYNSINRLHSTKI